MTMAGGDASSPFFFASAGGDGTIGTAAAAQSSAPWRRRGRPLSGVERNRGPGGTAISSFDRRRPRRPPTPPPSRPPRRRRPRRHPPPHHHHGRHFGGGTGGSQRPGGSKAAERAMSSSGSVRSLTGMRETPPCAFPVFCRTIGRVLDHEQGQRGNSERRGAGLALIAKPRDR